MKDDTRASPIQLDAVLMVLCGVSFAAYLLASASVRAFIEEAIRLAEKL